MRRAAAILAAAVVTLALGGCKKYSVELNLVAQPRVMISAGSDPLTPAYMARVYAWYVSEGDAEANDGEGNWAPASYADADAGVVRHRETGEERSFGLVGEQGEDGYVRMTLTRSPVVLVAVDPVNGFYAWRVFEFPLPFREPYYLPVTFRVYNASKPYEENDWTVVSLQSETAGETDGGTGDETE